MFKTPLSKKLLLPLLIIFIVITAVFCLRFLFGGPEDSWICQNGQWVKHGNPSSSMPASGCREKMLGGDRDEHGCIGSAGYSWCESKSKCLRVFEESCD